MDTAPTPTPPAPEVPVTPPPAEEPVENTNLLRTLLGYTQPEKKDVRPPEEPAPPPAPEPAPAPAPAPTPEPEKKVKVKVRPTSEVIDEAVKRALAEREPTPTPAPAPAPVTPEPAPAPIPDDLSSEEQAEVDLIRWAEAKDPAKKGLSDKFIKFYRDQKNFLQERINEEGDDYDPEKDPKFRRFLAQNEPKFPATERRKVERERLRDEISTEAYERAKKEFSPELKRTKAKLREIEERPKVEQRVGSFLDEVASGMPEDVYKFYTENGKDFEKTKAAFPLEYPIVEQVTSGAIRLSRDFLEIRRGIQDFNPGNPNHKFIDDFVRSQAQAFLKKGGAALTQNGKTFIPPDQWTPAKSDRHWTFEDEDVLNMIKVTAQREAKARIAEEQKRIETAGYIRKPAPTGATPPATPVPEPASPSIPASPLPGVSKSSTATDSSVVNNILGYRTK